MLLNDSEVDKLVAEISLFIAAQWTCWFYSQRKKKILTSFHIRHIRLNVTSFMVVRHTSMHLLHHTHLTFGRIIYRNHEHIIKTTLTKPSKIPLIHVTHNSTADYRSSTYLEKINTLAKLDS